MKFIESSELQSLIQGTKYELIKQQKAREDKLSSGSQYPSSITSVDSSGKGSTKELMSLRETEISLLPNQRNSFHLSRQSTSDDIHSSILGARLIDYRTLSTETLPPISSEGFRASTQVQKDDEDAKRFLVNAQRKSDYKKKMKNLNKCLAAAGSSKIQAEAYTNRAELLLSIREHDLAMLDTQRACAHLELLEESQILRKKLEIIRKSAHIALSQSRLDYRRIAIEYPFEVDAPEQSADNQILKFSRKIEEPRQGQVDETIYEDSLDKDWKAHQNWKVPTGNPRKLSPNVELVHNVRRGWHWRATREIIAGEPLSTQDYFAVKLSPETLHFYCSYCTIWFLALIPCTGCQMEMYCSERCRKKAFDSYHETECKLFPYLSDLKERELTLLALRIFLIGTKKGEGLKESPPLGLKSEQELHESMFMRNSLSKDYMSWDDYRAVLSLMWKAEEGRSFTEVLKPTLQHDVIKVFVGLRGLENFFPTRSINVFNPTIIEEEMLALSLFIQNTALLSYNRSTIYAQFYAKGGPELPRTKKIGCGLHILHSLLNNSCDPQAAIMRDRRRELVFALRRIEAFKEIHISYVGDYGKRSYNERKVDLKQKYAIDACYCEPCQKKETWQTWDQGLKLDIDYSEKRKPLSQAEVENEEEVEHEKRIKAKLFQWRKRFKEFLKDPKEFREKNLKRAIRFRKGQEYEPPSYTAWVCETVIRVLMQTLRGNFRTLERVTRDPSLPPAPHTDRDSILKLF